MQTTRNNHKIVSFAQWLFLSDVFSSIAVVAASTSCLLCKVILISVFLVQSKRVKDKEIEMQAKMWQKDEKLRQLKEIVQVHVYLWSTLSSTYKTGLLLFIL